MMFDKQFRFTGTHADKVAALLNEIEDNGAALFDSAMRVYLTAVKVGFVYKQKGEKNYDSNIPGFDKSIFAEQMLKIQEECKWILRMILLLDENYEPDKEKRLDKAFRELGKDENDLKLFESYLLGGVDILYEKLIKDTNNSTDFLNNVFFFIDDYNEIVNDGLTSEAILELCDKAQGKE